ncbi:MAG TPA: 16S rRNA (cytidine(1402)-2'-O)-methyltransferase [Gammaproteobacteria bacterium]|nr:16S rRNA (cytidine(1402)-2'-O)-methyltransferase [Gammaproteobacteria bacterium]
MTESNQGMLYVVATPIGNLDDLSPRARHTLAEVGLIAAEDTRHTSMLLSHFGIHTPLISLHDYNEAQKTPRLVEKLLTGISLALVSDAGTPLISDPGFNLVRAAWAAGVRVIPIPGTCALIAALSVSGLPTDRFVFEGFLPAKTAARKKRLADLATDPRTLVFYESIHRLKESLNDMAQILGGERLSVIARELTKLHEDVRAGMLAELVNQIESNSFAIKGEVVLMVAGAMSTQITETSLDVDHVLKVLLTAMPVKQAAALAAKITGLSKNQLYQRALGISGNKLV